MQVHGFDLETLLFSPGNMAPPPVCGSLSSVEADGQVRGRLMTVEEIRREAPRLVRECFLVTANGFYDIGVLVAAGIITIEEAFRLFEEGRLYDIQIAEALNAIAEGCLLADPRRLDENCNPMSIVDPNTGKLTNRYSQAVCADLVLGLKDAKAHGSLWRTRYAYLKDIPFERWPWEARQYPVDDVVIALEIALAQQGRIERPSNAAFPGKSRYRNSHEMAAQARAGWALHLASLWGMKTDAEKVAIVKKRVQAVYDAALEKFKAAGLIRGVTAKGKKEGSVDTIAVKRAVALAYMVDPKSKCPRCGGSGKLPHPKAAAAKPGTAASRATVTCEIEKSLTADKKEVWVGCDGTGLDLATAPGLPRTEKGAVSTSRDTLAQSGDDLLEEFGDVSESKKLLGTYLPFLAMAAKYPLNTKFNILVASGRTSAEGLLQLLPRGHGIRECFTARPGYVYCSVDYSAIELCTLAQVCWTMLGRSKMREVINESKDPGALHTAMAAKMIGVDPETFKKLVKSGDKKAKDFRQAAKALNFGFPGGMGAATLVLAKRKASEGETKSPDGKVVYTGIRFCILVEGRERCGTEKVVVWKDRPIPPTCKCCLEVAERLRKEWLALWNEIPEYFRKIPSMAEAADGEITQLFSERVRGGVEYSDALNTLFQGLAADGAKRALWRVSYECYVDKSSPLYGSRVVNFAHDEIITELREDRAHEAAYRQSEIMVRCMREVVPDVCVVAEPALSRCWTKGMEKAFDANGRLIPWDESPAGREYIEKLWKEAA